MKILVLLLAFSFFSTLNGKTNQEIENFCENQTQLSCESMENCIWRSEMNRCQSYQNYCDAFSYSDEVCWGYDCGYNRDLPSQKCRKARKDHLKEAEQIVRYCSSLSKDKCLEMQISPKSQCKFNERFNQCQSIGKFCEDSRESPDICMKGGCLWNPRWFNTPCREDFFYPLHLDLEKHYMNSDKLSDRDLTCSSINLQSECESNQYCKMKSDNCQSKIVYCEQNGTEEQVCNQIKCYWSTNSLKRCQPLIITQQEEDRINELQCSQYSRSDLCFASACMWDPYSELCYYQIQDAQETQCNLFHNNKDNCLNSGCLWNPNQELKCIQQFW